MIKYTSKLFSVVVPTYNRPRQLANCLAALVQQDYGCDRFEVIVVDDGSPVDMSSATDKFVNRLNIRLLTQRNAGPGAARNYGAIEARSRFLAFTDDDCCPESNWLSLFHKRLTIEPHRIIGGKTVNGLPDNPYAAASQQIVDFVYQYYNGLESGSRFFATNNMGLAADTFHAIGCFDPSFRTSEDRDFCDRATNKNFQLFYEPSAVVYHFHHLTMHGFIRQHLAYGRGACRFYRAHRCRSSGCSTLEISFYASTAGKILRTLKGLSMKRKSSLILLMIIWQGANVSGFVLEAVMQLMQSGNRK